MDEFEDFGVPAQSENKIPRWLFWTYILWIVWGIIWFYYFWNGSYGWLDRGYWYPLEEAAHTTSPYEKDPLL